MILSNHKDLDDNFFSVIIIGSGPAGISTALKLEEYKIKTLIVESGNLNEDFSKDKFLKGNLYGDFHPDEDISTKRDRTFGELHHCGQVIVVNLKESILRIGP